MESPGGGERGHGYEQVQSKRSPAEDDDNSGATLGQLVNGMSGLAP